MGPVISTDQHSLVFKNYKCPNNHIASTVYIHGCEPCLEVWMVIDGLRDSCRAIIAACRLKGEGRDKIRDTLLRHGEEVINTLLSMSDVPIPLRSRYSYLTMLVICNEEMA